MIRFTVNDQLPGAQHPVELVVGHVSCLQGHPLTISVRIEMHNFMGVPVSTGLPGSPQIIPQYADVPPYIDDNQIVSYSSTLLSR